MYAFLNCLSSQNYVAKLELSMWINVFWLLNQISFIEEYPFIFIKLFITYNFTALYFKEEVNWNKKSHIQMLKMALFDCAINEKCCGVDRGSAGGGGAGRRWNWLMHNCFCLFFSSTVPIVDCPYFCHWFGHIFPRGIPLPRKCTKIHVVQKRFTWRHCNLYLYSFSWQSSGIFW